MGTKNIVAVVTEFCKAYDNKFTRYDAPRIDEDGIKAWMYDLDKAEEPKKLAVACKRTLNNAEWKNQVTPAMILSYYSKMGGKVKKAKVRTKNTGITAKQTEGIKAEGGNINRMICIFNELGEDQRMKLHDLTIKRLMKCANPMLNFLATQKLNKTKFDMFDYILRRELAWTVARESGDARFMDMFPNSYANLDFIDAKQAKENREREREQQRRSRESIVKPSIPTTEPELQQEREPVPENKSKEPIPAGDGADIPW